MTGRDEYRAFLEQLKPIGYGDGFNSEPWPTYQERVGPLLPAFPEAALKHWLWRHYTTAVGEWQWLDLRLLAFVEQTWTTERVLSDVKDWKDHGLLDKWAEVLRTDPEYQTDELGAYMIEKGTWPVPPLVLPTSGELHRPDGLQLSGPFQLVEGYHRLGFLHALNADSRWHAKPMHTICTIVAPSASVLPYWPLNDNGA